jgi:hypothetical protein
MSTENSENRNIESNIEPDLDLNLWKKDSDPTAAKEEIKQSYFSATEKANEWIKIAHNFQHVKRSLKSYRNTLLEFIFEKIGYKYKGKIAHPNFLHLSAEAWILGIFAELEKEVNGNLHNLTFHNLINLIANIIVKENAFIENMEMLIGRFSYLEPFAKEDKIFRSMLIDLNSTKNEVLKDDKILKNFELSYEKFVNIMEKILRISFNVFLNNINSAEENKKSNLLFQNFESLRKQNKQSFEEFEKAYVIAKSIKDIPSDNLKHQLLGYFEFSMSNFDDLLKEIQSFNKNSGSVIFKIFTVLPKIYLLDLVHRRLEFLKNFSGNEFSLNNLRLENMRNFLAEFYKDSKGALGQALYLADDTGKELKKWVSTIQVVKMASSASCDFYANLKKNYGEYFIYGFYRFNIVFSVFKQVTLSVKETLGSYIITVLDKSVGSAFYLQRAIFGFIAHNFQNLKSALIGNDPLFRVNADDEHFYSIEVNKKLFIVNPELFFEFFAMVKGYLGKMYNLRFIVADVAGNVNRKIMGVASSISGKESQKNVELSGHNKEH